MPETAMAVGSFFTADAGAAAVAGGVADVGGLAALDSAAVAAEGMAPGLIGGLDAAGSAAAAAEALGSGGTAMGGAAGTLGAADSSAASAALGLGAADVGGPTWLSSLLTQAGGAGKAMWTGMGGMKGGLGVAEALSGLYGLDQSRRLQKMAMGQPNPANLTKMPGYQAGIDAVQRSMASQGYQGSGNMMAALQKYGGDAYMQQWQGQQAGAAGGANGLLGQLGSLGLLTSGIGNLTGWGH